MSRASDRVEIQMNKYVKAMREQGKEPTVIHVTQKQMDSLRAAKGEGPNYFPKFRDIEVRVAG